MSDPTLTQVLASHGYRHESSGDGARRRIIRVSDGAHVQTLSAAQAWPWMSVLAVARAAAAVCS